MVREPEDREPTGRAAEDATPVDLAEWASDFRATAGGLDEASSESIVARAEGDARKERWEWATQIGGLAFAAAVFLGLVVRMRSPLFTGFAAFVLPTLFALFSFFVYLRVGVSKNRGTSVADHVAAAMQRNRARHRVARAGLASLALLTTGFWVWLPIFVSSKSEKFAAEPWRLGVSVTAAIVVFGLAFYRCARLVKQTRSALESWRVVLASFEDPRPLRHDGDERERRGDQGLGP
ncbi:MAG: hypothetical protein KF795_02990 [Labilithrix sp.]|nr:hypothetical protein [Labilithrix sp.]